VDAAERRRVERWESCGEVVDALVISSRR